MKRYWHCYNVCVLIVFLVVGRLILRSLATSEATAFSKCVISLEFCSMDWWYHMWTGAQGACKKHATSMRLGFDLTLRACPYMGEDVRKVKTNTDIHDNTYLAVITRSSYANMLGIFCGWMLQSIVIVGSSCGLHPPSLSLSLSQNLLH